MNQKKASPKAQQKTLHQIEEWKVGIPTFNNADVYVDISVSDTAVEKVNKVHVVFTDPEDEVQEQWRYLNTVPTLLEREILQVLNESQIDEILEFIEDEEG